MTSTIISNAQDDNTVAPQNLNYRFSQYTLHWRRGQLLVKAPHSTTQPYLPSLDNEQLLVNCLKNSPVNLVSIDAKLGEAILIFWAEACHQANKPIFLRTSSSHQLREKNRLPFKKVQRLIDWMAALLLLLLVSPIMAGVIVLSQIYSPGSLFTYEWLVGEQGKLFRGFKFRTTLENQQLLCNTKNNLKAKSFERWIQNSRLEHLAKLFNILQGDMSLISSRTANLTDVLQEISQEELLNTVTQNVSLWQLNTEFQPSRP